MPVNRIDALKYFNCDEKRIIEIDNNSRWFIPSFISFQYGVLNENNRAHNSVITILNKFGFHFYFFFIFKLVNLIKHGIYFSLYL